MTEDYYRKESAAFLEENPVTAYMAKATDRLNEEDNRVTLYLDQSTRTKLMTQCEAVLISDHSEALHKEFQGLLENERTDGWDARRLGERVHL